MMIKSSIFNVNISIGSKKNRQTNKQKNEEKQ